MKHGAAAVLEGFSRYEISDGGEVRYRDSGRVCPDYSAGKGSNHRGYRKIKLYPDNQKTRKAFGVHRLVWLAFMGEIPEGYELDHINRDRGDNRLDNLRVIPKAANRRRGKARA